MLKFYILKMLNKNTITVNLANILELIYKQQRELAKYDKSFIREIPRKRFYTRKSVKEAIYYAQCADIEIYEYQLANENEKFEEAIDIAIFTLNILAYLGVRPDKCPKNMIVKYTNKPKKVLIELHKQLSEILYKYVDYKQWKFPKAKTVKISDEVENLLFELAKIGLSLAAYHASKYIGNSTKVLYNMIKQKMQKSRNRAKAEVASHCN